MENPGMVLSGTCSQGDVNLTGSPFRVKGGSRWSDLLIGGIQSGCPRFGNPSLNPAEAAWGCRFQLRRHPQVKGLSLALTHGNRIRLFFNDFESQTTVGKQTVTAVPIQFDNYRFNQLYLERDESIIHIEKAPFASSGGNAVEICGTDF
jgi:hypothetical protein